MGCDIDYPRSEMPWEILDIDHDTWFEAYPVEIRSGMSVNNLVCGTCGAVVGVRGARLHIEWHARED